MPKLPAVITTDDWSTEGDVQYLRHHAAKLPPSGERLVLDIADAIVKSLPIVKGSAVKIVGFSHPHTVVAVDGDVAWLRSDDGSNTLRALHLLTRA